MTFRKLGRRILYACITAAIIFGVEQFFSASGPGSKLTEGTDRPAWLPLGASEVFHRTQTGKGGWKVAEFTITEADLTAFAADRGWRLQQKDGYFPAARLDLVRPGEPSPTLENAQLIPRALVYQQSPNPLEGITLSYDPATSKAWYREALR